MQTNAVIDLEAFDPLVREWFQKTYGLATPAQQLAWPAIARGEHVLLTAPTGSGKTLSAFLFALNQLATGLWPVGGLRVLYISPLRALNNDIRENLYGPLAGMRAAFERAGRTFPEIRVMVRSGDSTSAERQRMLRRPPEILITTPESLSILLTSARGARIFEGLRTIILDEVHAVAARKRGVHMMSGVERLVPIAGEIQRISLSATVRPLQRIADFVGGYRLVRDADEQAVYEKRSVRILEAPGEKKIHFDVRWVVPPEDRQHDEEQGESPNDGAAETARDLIEDAPPRLRGADFWEKLVAELRAVVHAHRSTLIFTNSRRLAERISHLLNSGESEPLALCHHGSLSREIRHAVERRLKAGELRAIVSTSTLELGIDIGAVDKVVLVESPPAISSSLQRIGRAGHQVGATSEALGFPAHSRDLIDMAVLASAILERDIEPMRPIRGALDVLAQVIVSIAAGADGKEIPIDELYDFLRSIDSYHELGRREFELVLEMLAGRYQTDRLRELRPRIAIHRRRGTIQARDIAARLIYLAGGTIPDRGYFELRLLENNSRIGELDEEFVWERRVGDTFFLANHYWRIERITDNEVLVRPGDSKEATVPFWRAEGLDRDFHFSRRLSIALQEWNERLEEYGLPADLGRRFALDQESARALIGFLRLQRTRSGVSLPHRSHLVFEHLQPRARIGLSRHVIHTLWGGRVNRPLTLVLRAALLQRVDSPVSVHANNDCISCEYDGDVDLEQVLREIDPLALEGLIETELEESGYFGARFREVAGFALLLPRPRFGVRMPLWFSRRRARRLLERVRGLPDFPMRLETWRTCLVDEFDLENLRNELQRFQAGEYRISHIKTVEPTPFAADIARSETEEAMYDDDSPHPRAASTLDDELLREVVFGERSPNLDAALLEEFDGRLKRTLPGYAPTQSLDLLEWIKERLLIPVDEYHKLLSCANRDGAPEDLAESIAGETRIVRLKPGADEVLVSCEEIDRLQRLGLAIEEEGGPKHGVLLAEAGIDQDRIMGLADLVLSYLRYYGPVEPEPVLRVFGSGPENAEILDRLVEDGFLVRGALRGVPGEDLVCERENFENLLRLRRRRARSELPALPLERLPHFLAVYHGIGHAEPAEPESQEERLRHVVDRLLGYPGDAQLWESDFFPARIRAYRPHHLDELMSENGLLWFGCGRRKLTFGFEFDVPLFFAAAENQDAQLHDETERLFGQAGARFRENDLLDRIGGSHPVSLLWNLAWTGHVHSSSFRPVRKAIRERFKREEQEPGQLRGRWQRQAAGQDYWGATPVPERVRDPLQESERVRERVRLLVKRYGILFREILSHELPGLTWSRVFRELRLMELAGEIRGGYFVEGIPGLQFAGSQAVGLLHRGLPSDRVYWLNARDPISPCGWPASLTGTESPLPRRVHTNHVVFHDGRAILVSRRHGAELTVLCDPEDSLLSRAAGLFQALTGRAVRPLPRLRVERINGEAALQSRYRPALEAMGFRADDRYLTLRPGPGLTHS